MSAVPVLISGTLFDLMSKSSRQVVLMGEATIVGLTVGGGPIIPEAPPGGGRPPGVPTFPIWGPPGVDFPDKPGYPPVAGHPLPPVPIPPGVDVPPPGSPPVIVGGTQPTNPMVPPEAIVIEYPGIGKVVVPKPTETAAAK